MGIQTSSVNIDGTVAATGGTATTFLTKGQTLGQVDLILNDSSEFTANTKVQFIAKDPTVQSSAPNGYTQARSSVKILVPLALDNGARTVNTLELKLAVDHEMTAAEIESMLVLGAQLLADSDYSEFWKQQSLS